MSDAVETARAMLDLVRRSSWRDVYARTAEVELFLAKPGGARNPMRGVVVVEAPPSGPAVTVTAPHVATVVSLLPVGSHVDAGEGVCRIEVLGEHSDVPAPEAGRIATVLVAPGDLVEFGMPLFTMTVG